MFNRETDDFARQIARYNQELRETSRRASVPTPTPPTPEPPPRPIPTPPPSTPPDYPREDTGFLQVQVFTAREATPLAGAHIHVYEKTKNGDRVVTSGFTDNSGLSPIFSLPGVSAELSLKPGSPSPYVSYAVQIDAPGYYRVRSENVPIFSGVLSRQPVFMVPLPEQDLGVDKEILFPDASMQSLN